MKCLILDAMGVIFESADDVAELLIPFILEHGGCRIREKIEAAYLEASLGHIGPGEFWARVDLSAQLEDDYLARFTLNPGVLELLSRMQADGVPVWCLSNDVGRWSARLRENFGIEGLLAGSIISADVGVRKPDREIYLRLIDSSGYPAADLLFVDDREKNVAAASQLGIDSILFGPENGFEPVKTRLSQCAPA